MDELYELQPYLCWFKIFELFNNLLKWQDFDPLIWERLLKIQIKL